mgnify:FL=1
MSIDKSVFEKPLIDILDDACNHYADRICLQFKDETYTYAQVQALSIEVAQVLHGSGFKPGMHSAIYSLNSAKAFITTLGIIRAGGVWIPINPRNSKADNVKVLGNLGCQAFFYQDEFSSVLPSIKETLGGLAISICLDEVNGQGGFDAWLKGAEKTPFNVARHPADTITIPMTGGTTGLPKGVMLSDRNFQALCFAICTDLDRGEEQVPVYLSAAPMTHVGGRIVITSMRVGTRFVIKETIDLQDILKTIQDEKITDIFLPPTAIYGLLAQPNVTEFDYSSLKMLGYGSAPMSISQLKKAIEVFGPVLAGGFGQTECPMKITALTAADHFIDGKLAPDSRLRSVGRATLISEVAILDEQAQPMANGERGEIAVKGGNVSEGYFNDPIATQSMRKNGWHLTGDIGYMNEDGFVFIVDRKKDMIITGGFNVYSAEVEQGLSTIDGVAGVVVIGVPSDKWGEEVKAIIQLAPGTQLSAAEIMQVSKEKMGSVKAPKSVEFVDEFLKTPLGKIDKKMIRKEYWKEAERVI